MAASSGRSSPSLERDLFERGWEFDFFQAVRLLEWLYRDCKPVGQSASPADEIVQFAARLSLAFPASAIHALERNGHASARPRMTVAFFGLTGSKGVLPVHYTERMLASKDTDDNPLIRFFDIFNHRWTSLFFRAWQKHRPHALYESAALAGHRPDTFTHALFDLIGMGTTGLRGRMQMLDEPLLRYAGLISQRPHSAVALKGVLKDRFRVPITIEQFIGSWYPLNEFDRSYLAPEAERNQLGVGAFLGDRVWDQQAKFRIKVGPVAMAGFCAFLPDGDDIRELRELTRFFVGTAMAFEVQVVLKAPDVPKMQLGSERQDGPRLGWNSWLKTKEFQADAVDATFTYLN